LTIALAVASLSIGLAPQNPQASSGAYLVELRLPEAGIYANEEIDIEFRVMDPKLNDPILGMAGVPNLEIAAEIAMPSMPGMPKAKPKIHKEGVPGDYGIEAFFPHGGEYEIALMLPSTKDPVRFRVEVADERPANGKPAPKPFVLDSKLSGKNLSLKVIDSKTKKAVTAFDVAHEKRFHLLVASSDFGWFLHEHPEMAPDGTWSVNVDFPAGGDYWVYGDVAPVGKGSQILISRVRVPGSKPHHTADWKTNLGPTADQGVTGVFGFVNEPEVGRNGKVKIQLSHNGAPVSDLEKWLGAWAHLMIFSPDGQTVVHSHPDEGVEGDALAANGEVQFSARFPKSGKYRVFAQFQRDGKVHTIPFTIEVPK